MMKKKILVGILIAFTLFLILFASYYFYSLTPVNKNNKNEIVFIVEPGMSKIEIAKKLKKSGVIKSKNTLLIYLFFNSDLSLQAGKYSLNKSMSPSDILKKFHKGDIKVETTTVRFGEGKRLKEYVALISQEFGYDEDEIISVINDKKFLNEMINKYWFLTDSILNDNIYYGLEGYIFPDTYEFMSNEGIEEIFVRVLNYTDQKLSMYKNLIEKSNYSVHDIITMASIIELEANSKEDRQKVSQVIYKRMEYNMSLGMDVTTYYATQKEMGDVLTYSDLVSGNPYNTRNTNKIGLPVGPICNPSLESIEAVFEPSDTDYLYFYADIKTGLVYFAKTSAEFNQIIKEVG